MLALTEMQSILLTDDKYGAMSIHSSLEVYFDEVKVAGSCVHNLQVNNVIQYKKRSIKKMQTIASKIT